MSNILSTECELDRFQEVSLIVTTTRLRIASNWSRQEGFTEVELKNVVRLEVGIRLQKVWWVCALLALGILLTGVKMYPLSPWITLTAFFALTISLFALLLTYEKCLKAETQKGDTIEIACLRPGDRFDQVKAVAEAAPTIFRTSGKS